ncbi:SHOCT domain-containing protein [Rhodohalobacter sp. SW132]|uniref:SHOCT domain-containing protein n=1 Tax=Rhodohalobacter sp. SW132 TaxID=2293433 RepID=UPI000E229146|nr:SHOCT domain-containing protein [Rhodohalobacter sp. SW132]REL39153.1 SHOCT domain-containing protein [Rhodohalobacter sp. SW132]
MEIITTLLMIGIVLTFFYGVFWVMAKFFGATFYHPVEARQAQSDRLNRQEYLNRIATEEPDIYKEAISNCKKKHFRVTTENVIGEVNKIKKQRSSKPSSTQKLRESLLSIKKSLTNDKTSSKLDKLEKLQKLRENNVITDSEFEKLKKDII